MTHPGADTSWRALLPQEEEAARRALLRAQIAPSSVVYQACAQAILIPTLPAPFGLHGPRGLLAHIALCQRASGITLGRRIYIRHEFFDPEHHQLPLDLVVHEMAHVVQFLRDGTAAFLARYLWEYARNMTSGMGDRESYLGISYEREARHVESCLQG